MAALSGDAPVAEADPAAGVGAAATVTARARPPATGGLQGDGHRWRRALVLPASVACTAACSACCWRPGPGRPGRSAGLDLPEGRLAGGQGRGGRGRSLRSSTTVRAAWRWRGRPASTGGSGGPARPGRRPRPGAGRRRRSRRTTRSGSGRMPMPVGHLGGQRGPAGHVGDHGLLSQGRPGHGDLAVVWPRSRRSRSWPRSCWLRIWAASSASASWSRLRPSAWICPASSWAWTCREDSAPVGRPCPAARAAGHAQPCASATVSAALRRRWRPVRREYALTANSLYSHESQGNRGNNATLRPDHHRVLYRPDMSERRATASSTTPWARCGSPRRPSGRPRPSGPSRTSRSRARRSSGR